MIPITPSWTQAHYVTRNSMSESDNYYVWNSCRCGWSSGILPDGHLPTTHQSELEHYVSAWKESQDD